MLGSIRRPWALLALVVALSAVLLSRAPSASENDDGHHVQGKNNTVLFLANSNHGYSNVHLATSYALLENHPSVKLHFGTFEKMRARIHRVSQAGANVSPNAQPISFNLLPSAEYLDAVAARGIMAPGDIVIPPGLAGSRYMSKNLRWILSPWLQEDHLVIYRRCKELIEEIDPAVVVLDPMFRPAVEAVQDANRLYAILSPNTVEAFVSLQPWGKWLWKYPAIMSGFGYPLPWTKIPANILAGLNLVYYAVTAPGAGEARKFLRENGIQNPLDFVRPHRTGVPWITQAMREAAMPLEYIPPNVATVGPILFSLAPAEVQDSELVLWLEKAPTVLVNLGSVFEYSEDRARLMATAIKNVLEKTDVQILWKMAKDRHCSDEFREELRGFVDEGRLRIEDWLAVDPAALVHSEHIVASVHHGGSNCYHEALSAGVPQVLLPMWADLYDYATSAEYFGVGVWGCRGTSPDWTVDCLTEAVLRVLDEGESGIAMRREAGRLGEMARESPGRDAAAREIAQLAGVGKT